MDIPTRDKEVHFHQYCMQCEYFLLEPTKDPCNECLHHPSNENSHKPVKFKKKEIK